jgi:hypothetical protein
VEQAHLQHARLALAALRALASHLKGVREVAADLVYFPVQCAPPSEGLGDSGAGTRAPTQQRRPFQRPRRVLMSPRPQQSPGSPMVPFTLVMPRRGEEAGAEESCGAPDGRDRRSRDLPPTRREVHRAFRRADLGNRPLSQFVRAKRSGTRPPQAVRIARARSLGECNKPTLAASHLQPPARAHAAWSGALADPDHGRTGVVDAAGVTEPSPSGPQSAREAGRPAGAGACGQRPPAGVGEVVGGSMAPAVPLSNAAHPGTGGDDAIVVVRLEVRDNGHVDAAVTLRRNPAGDVSCVPPGPCLAPLTRSDVVACEERGVQTEFPSQCSCGAAPAPLPPWLDLEIGQARVRDYYKPLEERLADDPRRSRIVEKCGLTRRLVGPVPLTAFNDERELSNLCSLCSQPKGAARGSEDNGVVPPRRPQATTLFGRPRAQPVEWWDGPSSWCERACWLHSCRRLTRAGPAIASPTRRCFAGE